MTQIIMLSGSPAPVSRSAHLLTIAASFLAQHHIDSIRIDIRTLPQDALLHGDLTHPQIVRVIEAIKLADGIVIATPLYQASYSGLLKVFFDLLPYDALHGKPTLTLATGGSLSHLLAIEYTLNPVLAALGVEHIVRGVLATEVDFHQLEGGFELGASVKTRLSKAVGRLAQIIGDKLELQMLRQHLLSPQTMHELPQNICIA